MPRLLASLTQFANRRGALATLVAIVSLVGLVSVPCVEAFALRANERDARVALHLLDDALERALGSKESDPATLDLPMIWASDEDARHRLIDARIVREDLLLYHGYFIAWTEREHGRGELVAWPRLAGTTGRVAYALDVGGTLERRAPIGR